MAIAFDAGSGAATNGTTSQTVSHTCSGSDRALLVAVTGNTGGDNITGVTYNGVAMTLVEKILNNRWLYLFFLANPDSGTHDIVASASASIYIGVAAGSYTGVKQTGQPEANNEASSHTVAVTTVTDNSWAVMAGKREDGSIAAGADTTLRANDGFGGGLTGLLDSGGAVSPAGSKTLNFNSGTNTAAVICAIAPAEQPATKAPPMLQRRTRFFARR